MTVSGATSMQRVVHGSQPGKLRKCAGNSVPVFLLHRLGEAMRHTLAIALSRSRGNSVRHREFFAEINFFVGNKFMRVFGGLPR
jgi:hypothetical protein